MSDEKTTTPGPGPRRHRRRKPARAEGEAAKSAAAPAKTGQPAGARQSEAAPRQADRRDGERRPRPGKRDRDGGRRDGKRPEKAAPVIRSTEATVDRGADYVISKRTEFDANTHKPVAVSYKLTRNGLPEPKTFARLADAREAAKAPIEVPPPENAAIETEAAAPEPPASEGE